MFICNSCLEKNYQNSESIFKSRGPCESCKKMADCNEIKSSFLRTKADRNYRKVGIIGGGASLSGVVEKIMTIDKNTGTILIVDDNTPSIIIKKEGNINSTESTPFVFKSHPQLDLHVADIPLQKKNKKYPSNVTLKKKKRK